MKKTMKGFLITLIALSLIACGNNKGASADNVVTFAKENDVISMDSRYATDGMSFEIIAATIEGLMCVDADGNIIYALAESHTVSDDQLTWTFKLRDATWDNGEAVTADDFVYAWQATITSPDAEYNYLYTDDAASILNAEAVMGGEMDAEELGIKALDEKTVEVVLTKPVSFFDSLMTFPVFFPINRAFATEAGDQYGLTPDKLLSNGPFKLKEWSKGNKLELVKNENYWDKDNVKVDGLVFNIVAEASTAALDYESGSTDFVKLNSDLVDKYKDTDGFTNMLEGYLWYNQYNLESEILQNKNIRMALSLAVDRDALVNDVLKDGSVTGDGFVPVSLATGPDGKDYRESAPVYLKTDKEKAKEYWEAGKKELNLETVEIRYLFEGSDPAKPAAEFIHSELVSTLDGLVLNMETQPKENRIDMQKKGDFDVVLTRWGPDFADPTTYLGLMVTNGNYNYGKYSSATYDDLYNQAANENDPVKRWQLLLDTEAVLMEDAGVAPMFQVGGATLINPKVVGVESHSVSVPYIYKNVAFVD